MPYLGSSSDEIAGALRKLGGDLERIGFQMKKANTPAEVEALRAQMHLRIKGTMDDARNWAKDDLRAEYNKAYDRGAGAKITKPKADQQAGYVLRQKALASVNRMDKEAKSWADDKAKATLGAKGAQIAKDRAETLRKQIPGLTGADKAKAISQLEKLNSQAEHLTKAIPSTGDKPTIGYFKKGRGNRDVYSREPWDHYVNMATGTIHQRVTNVGLLRGARKNRPSAYFIVSDGDDCGWTQHSDPEKANGKVVTAEEALKYPIAHPNCTRSFDETDKKGARAAKAAKAARDKKIAQAVAAKLAEDKKAKAKKAAKAAVTVAKVGTALYNSQALRIIAGGLYDNRADLPAVLQPVVAKWAKFSTKEEFAISQVGSKISKEIAVDNLRNRVMAETNASLKARALENAADDAIVNIGDTSARILGLTKETEYGKVISALDDYTDYVAHARASALPWYENLKDAGIRTEARAALDGVRAVGASDYLGSLKPTGPFDAVGQSIGVLRKIIEEDPHRLAKAAVGDIAQSVDPLSWARVNMGKFRFMVGTHSAERRRFAETLFEQVSDSRRYAPEDVAYFRDVLGKTIDGSERLTKQDLVDLLTPRVTYNPTGGLFSATVGLERGNLVPVFRMYPPGAIGKIFSLDSRLRAGAFTRIMQDIQRGELGAGLLKENGARGLDDLTEYLKTIRDEETITNINIWRNGPVVGNVRLWGNTVDSVGLKIKPDQEWFRATARWYRFEERFMGYDADGNPMFSDSKLGSLFSNVAFLPNRAGSLVVNARDKVVQDIIVAFHRWSGNALEVARQLGIPYRTVHEALDAWRAGASEQVSRAFDSAAERAKYLARVMDRVAGDDRSRIHGFRDLLDYTKNVWNDPETFSYQESVYKSAATKNLTGFSGAESIAKGDLNFFTTVFEHEFPGVRVPGIAITDDAAMGDGALMQYRYSTGNIESYSNAFTDAGWKTLESMHRKMRSIGHLNPNATGRMAKLWHESTHHLLNQLSPTEYRSLWKRITALEELPIKGLDQSVGIEGTARLTRLNLAKDHEGINRIVNEWIKINPRRKQQSTMEQFITQKFGRYAATDPEEWLSEMVAERMTALHPDPLTIKVFEFIKDALR